MIIFDQAHMGNANHAAQYQRMNGQRILHNNMQRTMINLHGAYLPEPSLIGNQTGIFTPLFWAEIDRQGIEVRENDRGREFMADLMGIATPLNIGKKLAAYTAKEDISYNTEISMDGNAVDDFDSIDYQNEGDPVPIFSGGYGVNWRDWEGMKGEQIDLIADSARAKKKVILERMADYLLNGSSKIEVNGFKGQGIKNHRHTIKVDMTVAGVNLVTGTNDQILNFFNQILIIEMDAQFVDYMDVMWVSPDIMRNLMRPFTDSGGFKEGTLLEYVQRYGKVKSIRQTYKLVGNEWFGYVRQRDVISPLVGAALSTVPIPRVMPHDNYNFLEWSAMGLTIKSDVNGRGGVFYGANFT